MDEKLKVLEIEYSEDGEKLCWTCNLCGKEWHEDMRQCSCIEREDDENEI